MRFDSPWRSRQPSALGFRLQCWPSVATTLRSRNQSRRFCLRRPSGQIEFEFRDGDLRVFYRVEDGQVLVDAIGRKHGNQSAHRRQEGDPVKIENIREVKTRFSRYIKELSETTPSSLPKNGRPCAALVPVTEDTDLEAVPLSQNKRFRNFIDNEIARGQPEGFIDLEDLQ
jgi:antitoxin (DNA-binding transcriptional repressor) of toxin-antitoxin stability system